VSFYLPTVSVFKRVFRSSAWADDRAVCPRYPAYRVAPDAGLNHVAQYASAIAPYDMRLAAFKTHSSDL
jgi:hypothetical protein